MDTGFDLRNEMIGTGPFQLADYKPSTSFTLKRNPDYFLKGLPYADGYQTFRSADPSVPDNAFRAKQIKGHQALRSTPCRLDGQPFRVAAI